MEGRKGKKVRRREGMIQPGWWPFFEGTKVRRRDEVIQSGLWGRLFDASLMPVR